MLGITHPKQISIADTAFRLFLLEVILGKINYR